MSVERYA